MKTEGFLADLRSGQIARLPFMLELTECLGTDVVDADGVRLGKLVDLAALLEHPYPMVSRLQVRTARRSVRYVPWRTVADLGVSGVQLTARAEELEGARAGADSLQTDELLLAEHVLDTQILDIGGKRVVRVGEVELAPEGNDLLVAGVEVGRASLFRRLGLRRYASRMQPELVDWRDLHIASGRGHALQLRTTGARVHHLGASELAQVVSRLPVAYGADVLRAVGPETAAEALGTAHPELGGRLVGELDPREAALIVAEMQAPNATDALRHLPGEQSEQVLAAMPTAHSRTLRQLLARPARPTARHSPVRDRFRKVLSARRRAPS
jgi:sporulation protein YlmC with PRC-barrel domain